MDYPGKVITKTQVTPTQTSASGNWTLDDQAAAIKNNNWPVALVPNPIFKSLRFNSADNAYLNRTPASASNRKTWTWSGWVKRSKLGAQQGLIGCSVGTSDSTYMNLQFNSGDLLGLGLYTQYVLLTTQVFRDASAWYHVVVSFDTTNATANNRCRMYVNGVEITAFTTRNNPTLNADYGINQASQHDIGRSEYTNSTCLGGYLTEVNFIDGQALTPSSFGMTNPQTGQWIPLKYSGTYGTNGFYLNFKDATSTTTLGYDYSGNANNWTTNNFSVTAGAGNDSLTDVPTPWVAYNTTGDVGGVIRGNYATWNPLIAYGSTKTVSNGNLLLSGTVSAGAQAYSESTIYGTSGKWYAEFVSQNLGNNNSSYIGFFGGVSRYYAPNGQIFNGSSWVSYGASYTNNDIIGVAVDVTNTTVEFFKNGASQGQITGITGLTSCTFFCSANSATATPSWEANFGQRPFAYTPPTGFRSLCTTNLPATAIGFGLTNQGNKYFDVTLYTGNGSTTTVANSGSMQPDLVWVKNRTTAQNHVLVDVLRGNTNGLFSNLTDAAFSDGGFPTITSTGFSVGNSSWTNQNGSAFVGWQWKAGGTGVSNTAGTITSTVSANTTAGFSIVTYTGNGSSSATVGHGLGVAPDMVIVKARSGGSDWEVFHRSLSASNGIRLNTTAAQFAASSVAGGIISTSPTSTTFGFTAGTSNVNNVNENGVTWVAYCFDAVPGYSAFGSYTGNGSTDGPFVYTGFRPKYVMIKGSSFSGGNWLIWDTVRATYNAATPVLFANLSNAEDTAPDVDILSNGFKLRTTSNRNTNGETYIYACFAESPFQFANAR